MILDMKTMWKGKKTSAGISAAISLWAWGILFFSSISLYGAGPKVVLTDVLYKPTFLTANTSFPAGSAFPVRLVRGGKNYLVTSFSLFGKTSGLDHQLTPTEIAQNIMGGVATSAAHPRQIIVAQPYLLMSNIRVADDNGADGDMAIFGIRNSEKLPSLYLDPTLPAKGDRMFALVKGPSNKVPVLVEVETEWVSPTEIRYLFLDSSVDLVGACGAPILSAQGKVVAMHLGTFTSKSGNLFGFAAPARAIKKALELYEKEHPAAKPAQAVQNLEKAPTPATAAKGKAAGPTLVAPLIKQP